MQFGNDAVVKELIKNGADLNAKNKWGWGPMEHAIQVNKFVELSYNDYRTGQIAKIVIHTKLFIQTECEFFILSHEKFHLYSRTFLYLPLINNSQLIINQLSDQEIPKSLFKKAYIYVYSYIIKTIAVAPISGEKNTSM